MSGATASARNAAAPAAVTTRTATATAVTTSSTTVPAMVALDCSVTNPQGLVRPSQYVLACGDGNAGLSGLHWTAWTAQLASGYGAYYLNDCRPFCVSGHFHAYPALVMLWGSAAVKGQPSLRHYTHVTLIFTGKRAPSYQQVNGKGVTTYPVSQTLPLWP
jgi:hypothetical protein